ncbi:MAG: phosphomannomutase [Rhodospirillales bacterium CG15_BIG_FIL_POST_REV_8_21_14_020_66_15]|nr:MAG: phosphomannomutase [Rhodospirillales bacterium CG15_BIG_FIL_POST_REV_8_21_14_020_66_15]
MTYTHRFHPSICRANDIRGVVNETLTEEDAYALGRGLATMVVRDGGKSIAVGRDGRESSPSLADAVCCGIEDSGGIACAIGVGPTPMLYFATHSLDVSGGVMVTGSHNPPGYNGFKLVLGTQVFQASTIRRLSRLLESGDLEENGAGTIIYCPVRETYVEAMLDRIEELGSRSCAWDPGNGAVGAVIEDILGRLPGQHVAINATVDGTFPAHHPDPSDPDNLLALRELVVTRKCDVGFAFDGDGDRLGIVDSRGRIVWPDQYLALLARPILRRMPGAKVIADVKSSDVLFDVIAAAGGSAEMCKTGHALVKQRLRETGAILAGEMSGHIFFADRWFGFDDALYAALRILEALQAEGIEMSEFFDQLPQTSNTPEIRLTCDDAMKFEVVKEVSGIVAARNGNVIDIDGVRVKSDGGWWLLRASNTEPALVARCEARNEQSLTRLKDELAEILGRIGVDGSRLYGG